MRFIRLFLLLVLFAGFGLNAHAVGGDLFNNTGDMEGLTVGAEIPQGEYGDITTPGWYQLDYTTSGAGGGGTDGLTFHANNMQNHTCSGTKSLKWTLPAGYDHWGAETNYFDAVAAVPGGIGSYVLTGWIRQEGHTDNFIGGPGIASNFIGGAGGAGGEQWGNQWSDGTNIGGSFGDRLTQMGYEGYNHLTGAPQWEGFGCRFTLPTAGPFNGNGKYLGLGLEHMNPTQSTNGMTTWMDDLLCVKAGDDSASGDNLCPGGSFETMTGSIPVGSFGDSPGWYWANYGGNTPYSSVVIDTTQHNNGAKSLKWQMDGGQASNTGDELYYQKSVDANIIPKGEYVFSGYIRQSGKCSNYTTGTVSVPSGLNCPGSLVLAIQVHGANDGPTPPIRALADLTDMGYVGDIAGNATSGNGSPAWKGFAKTFLMDRDGPFNSGGYFSIGFWHANPTVTLDGPVITWLDDLECRPVQYIDLLDGSWHRGGCVPVELSSIEIE